MAIIANREASEAWVANQCQGRYRSLDVLNRMVLLCSSNSSSKLLFSLYET